MNHNKELIFIALCFIIAPSTLYGQDAVSKTYTDTELKSAALEIMKASGTCALITLDEKSIPMVRIMDVFPAEKDFTIWFGTTAHSRKVEQIRNNPVVTLYYEDSDKTGYVVIHGTAVLVDDPKEKQNRWKESWENFYPEEREGYLLIKVIPDSMEILSVSRGITGDEVTWETPTMTFE